MSELLDKQVNAQKEKTSRVHAAHEKVCDENERNKETRNKNNTRIKVIFMEGSPL